MIAAVVFCLLGLVVGALGAHVAETLMAGRTWETPRCAYCAAPYRPIQWSATLALLLGARCAQCGKSVRWQRLVGEWLLALTWAGFVYRYGVTGPVVLALLAVIPLAMVTVTDLETRLIPNRIVLPAILAWLVLGLVFGPTVPGLTTAQPWWSTLAGGLFGFGVFWLLEFLGSLAFGEGALGGGDVKLVAYVGLLVGFPLIVEALILAILLGGVGGFLVLLARRASLRTAIPYGPFIVLGALMVMLWGVEITQWWFR